MQYMHTTIIIANNRNFYITSIYKDDTKTYKDITELNKTDYLLKSQIKVLRKVRKVENKEPLSFIISSYYPTYMKA